MLELASAGLGGQQLLDRPGDRVGPAGAQAARQVVGPVAVFLDRDQHSVPRRRGKRALGASRRLSHSPWREWQRLRCRSAWPARDLQNVND
jgi:hypothetical protein